MTELTEIEKEMWSLYQSGRTRKRIMRDLDLNISERTFDRYMNRIRVKLGLKLLPVVYKQPEGPRPTVKEIINEEAKSNGMSVSEFLAPTRENKRVRLRQMAMYRARVETQRSYPEIARAFGMDHTTVMYAVKKIASELESKDDGLV